MNRITTLKYEHLIQMRDAQGLFAHMDLELQGHDLIRAGVGFAMFENDEVLGCGGVIPRWQGVGELWIAVSSSLKERPLLLVRSTLGCIQLLHEKGGFHRLQLHIRSDDAGLRRWAESLGFTFEGTMLQYGPDKHDHDLFARIF